MMRWIAGAVVVTLCHVLVVSLCLAAKRGDEMSES